MPHLAGHGIEVQLPAGWEGHIYRREAPAGAVAYPVVHAATFALPARLGDFASGAVEVMSPEDALVVLVEFAPDSLGSALFAHPGMPRSLTPSRFSRHTVKRAWRDQAGSQWFFTEQGRPFTLYALIGSFALRHRLVPRVNELLRGISVAPVSQGASA